MKTSLRFRPFLSFLILVIFMFTMVGTFNSYFTFLNRQHFQAQVKQQRPEDLKRLIFSENEYRKIKWEDKDREFEFNGKMYDVASIQFKEGLYTITCENDLIEDLLIGFLKSDSKSKGKILQFQLSVPESALEIDLSSCFKTDTNSSYQFGEYLISLEGISPPPRFHKM